MQVLVTGATGGLGELVIHHLLKNKHQVIATSRSKEKFEKLSFKKDVEFIPYDFSNPLKINLFDYFKKPDCLIHLAWDKLNEYRNEAHTNEILPNHILFLENLIQHGLKNITSVGTCYEYGLQEGELIETMESKPEMLYPIAKNLLREHLEKMKLVNDFNFKWIRVFYVFGAMKERKNLYTLLMDAINKGESTFNMSGGEQVRDFLSPNQIAETIFKVSIQNKVQGIINCCSGKPVKLKEFILDFLQKNNYKINLNLGFYPYPNYEPMETWGSTKKLNQAIEAH